MDHSPTTCSTTRSGLSPGDTAIVRVIVVAIATLSAACSNWQPPAAPTPAPLTLALTGCGADAVLGLREGSQPARIYVNSDLYRYRGMFGISCYVLGNEGVFELRFPSRGIFPGTYKGTNGVVTFQWNATQGGSRRL